VGFHTSAILDARCHLQILVRIKTHQLDAGWKCSSQNHYQTFGNDTHWIPIKPHKCVNVKEMDMDLLTCKLLRTNPEIFFVAKNKMREIINFE